jgi:hypothetical protein
MRGAILQLAENSLSFFLFEADGTTGERGGGREGDLIGKTFSIIFFFVLVVLGVRRKKIPKIQL